MASASPPKPWERAGGGATSSALATTPGVTSAPGNTTTTTTSAGNLSSGLSNPPAIPERPSALNSVVNRTASNYSNSASTYNRPYGSSPYGLGSSYSSPYGGGIGSSMYSSPYSRFGGGSMYGGGMYGGGMYGGGMGSMYGGGMYGGGMGGMPGMDPNDPNASLTNNFAQSTQATFQIIESIVGAFGGFAQMLESTYMATHSSFFAMVSVAEQFGNLRTTLGSVLGIFTLLRWSRSLIAKLTGRPPPADATALTPSAFAAFTGQPHPTSSVPSGHLGHVPPKPSKKPFIVFLLAVFGLPYLMGKLIRALARNQEEQQAAAAAQNPYSQQQQFDANGQPIPRTLDPSKLDFCRVLYDFPPPEAVQNNSFSPDLDLQVKKGDLVAVLDKSAPVDPHNPQPSPSAAEVESSWWRCRARDGRMGYLPAVYLETIQRRPEGQRQITASANSAPGSRAQTMSVASSASVASASRAQTMASSVEPRARTMDSAITLPSVGGGLGPKGDGLKVPVGKRSDEGKRELVEQFQKSSFYNP